MAESSGAFSFNPGNARYFGPSVTGLMGNAMRASENKAKLFNQAVESFGGIQKGLRGEKLNEVLSSEKLLNEMNPVAALGLIKAATGAGELAKHDQLAIDQILGAKAKEQSNQWNIDDREDTQQWKDQDRVNAYGNSRALTNLSHANATSRLFTSHGLQKDRAAHRAGLMGNSKANAKAAKSAYDAEIAVAIGAISDKREALKHAKDPIEVAKLKKEIAILQSTKAGIMGGKVVNTVWTRNKKPDFKPTGMSMSEYDTLSAGAKKRVQDNPGTHGITFSGGVGKLLGTPITKKK